MAVIIRLAATVAEGRSMREPPSSFSKKYMRAVSPEKLPEGMEVDVRIRYKDSGGPGRVWQEQGGRFRVEFASPRRAVTPGQSAALYEGDDLLGGGIIAGALG